MPSTTSIEQLRDIMRKLRDPETGCEWDIRQNFSSIAAFTLEEAYEVVDAIERNDLDDLKDELGDLLLQVVFHAQMADEQNLFDFDDIAQAISDKMLRRHPHVFGDTRFETEKQLKASWESIKAKERQDKRMRKGLTTASQPDTSLKPSALDGVAVNLPALKRADKIQKRAARVGFDWPDTDPVWKKLSEEIDEVRAAVQAADNDAIEDEIGDVLFTVVNLARHLNVDSEAALRRASAKFERRFRQVENLADREPLDDLDLAQLDSLWDKAKRDD